MANIPQLNAMTSVDLVNLIPEKWDSTIIHNAYQEAFWVANSPPLKVAGFP